MTQRKKQVTTKVDGKTATLIFMGAIDAASVEEIMETIAALPRTIKTLYFLLTTEGGSVSHGFALYNLLRALPHRLVMHNVGNVDSIGNTVFMAAETRYATPNATFLLHPVKSRITEQVVFAHMVMEKLSSIQMDEKRIHDILVKHTRIPHTDLKSFFTCGQVKDASYALRTGIVTAIADIPVLTKAQVIKVGNPPD